MKIGDLVICKRAYNKKGIIVNIRKRMYYSEPVCDVWVYELDDDIEEGEDSTKKILTFMMSQLEVISEGG